MLPFLNNFFKNEVLVLGGECALHQKFNFKLDLNFMSIFMKIAGSAVLAHKFFFILFFLTVRVSLRTLIL